MGYSMNRRKFIKTTALATTASFLPSSLFAISSNKLQVGIIGTGLRGQWMTKLLLDRSDVDIPVICDIDEKMIDMVLNVFEKQGRPKPKIYRDGPEDFRNMVSNED